MGIFGDMEYSVGAVFVMTALVSFLGFLVENLWLIARKGYMDNRNMHTPFLVGYGAAIMGFYFVLGTPSNLRFFGTPSECGTKSQFAAYFIFTFILVSLGEMLLGTVIEKSCGLVWWDYTQIPFHITKYTSVPTSIGFTIIIVTFMDCFFERGMNALMELETVKVHIYGIILMVVMVIDFLLSMYRMETTGELMVSWKIDFREKSFERNKYKYHRK